MLTLVFWSLQSTFQTAFPPSTIADLYSAIASLIKESNSNTAKLIEESKKRQKSYFTAELTKIREEIKVGEIREEIKVVDTPAKKSTEENLGTSKQKNDKVSEEVIYCHPLNLVFI